MKKLEYIMDRGLSMLGIDIKSKAKEVTNELKETVTDPKKAEAMKNKTGLTAQSDYGRAMIKTNLNNKTIANKNTTDKKVYQKPESKEINLKTQNHLMLGSTHNDPTHSGHSGGSGDWSDLGNEGEESREILGFDPTWGCL